MTTPLDRMRTAWTTDGRLALHRVVEVMAAEGVTRVALDAAVDDLLAEARAAGVEEDTQEDILGVGDRLSGWCHENTIIKTRENTPAAVPAPGTNGSALPLCQSADVPVSR